MVPIKKAGNYAALSLIFAVISPAYTDWGPAERLPDNVNSPYLDYGVCVSPDGNTIYFASNRDNPASIICDIYYSERQGNGWTNAQKLPSPINTADEENTPCLSWDGSKLFFSRWSRETEESDIYVSEWQGGSWGNPYKIPGEVNKDGYDEMGPAVTADSTELYFTAYYWPGNLGMNNIWVATWSGSEWRDPKLIPGINTTSDEGDAAPTYDGRYLYFYSWRDVIPAIFRAEKIGNGWGNVTRLNDNVNGPDLGQSDPSVTKDGRYLFFARSATGQWWDLYVSKWECEPNITPTSLGRLKAMFR